MLHGCWRGPAIRVPDPAPHTSTPVCPLQLPGHQDSHPRLVDCGLLVRRRSADFVHAHPAYCMQGALLVYTNLPQPWGARPFPRLQVQPVGLHHAGAGRQRVHRALLEVSCAALAWQCLLSGAALQETAQTLPASRHVSLAPQPIPLAPYLPAASPTTRPSPMGPPWARRCWSSAALAPRCACLTCTRL